MGISIYIKMTRKDPAEGLSYDYVYENRAEGVCQNIKLQHAHRQFLGYSRDARKAEPGRLYASYRLCEGSTFAFVFDFLL